MLTKRPPTRRLQLSQPAPSVHERPVTDNQETVRDLLFGISVLPEQFYDRRASLAIRRPEAELMRAVLEDALMCFQSGLTRQGRRAKRLAREAEGWVFSDDTGWLFLSCPFAQCSGWSRHTFGKGSGAGLKINRTRWCRNGRVWWRYRGSWRREAKMTHSSGVLRHALS